jgi:hypothetical protein
VVNLKILHIINSLAAGGAEKLIEEILPLMNNLEGIKADVLLLTDDKNAFQESLKSKGVKVDVISLKKIYSPLNIFKIKTYIEEGNYDIVHSHLFPTQYWVGIAKTLLKSKEAKFVTSEHSSNNRRRRKFYFRPIDRYIYSKYDCIICVTDRVRLNLINWIKPKTQEQEKFIVINNGVNINKYKEAIPYEKSELCSTFTQNIKLICMVGRFSEAKDQPTLIKAIEKLPEDVHLLLIGEGPLKQQNQNLAKKIGIDNRVHFLGLRNDVDRILKTSDIVVLSSNWEGLSLASIEGMASGKPFIASKVEGLEEIVGGYGLLFEHGNSEELSSILEKLLNNDDFYKDICVKCSIRAEEFNINFMIKLMLSMYDTLLN